MQAEVEVSGEREIFRHEARESRILRQVEEQQGSAIQPTSRAMSRHTRTSLADTRPAP